MTEDFLDSVFTQPEGASEAVEAPEAPETAAQPQEAPSGPLRGPDGKFIPKAETGVEPAETQEAVPPTDKLPKEDYKAIREEREKRQRLESELEALRQTVQQLQAPKEPPAPPPTIWEDEQGWQRHLQAQVLQQADQLSRINASEMAARAQHADFQEMFDLFNEMAAQNPSVVQQAMADPHPWGKAYQIAQNYKSMQDLGATNLADLEAKIEARLMEKLAAERQSQTPTVPASLADAQSSNRATSAPSGPLTIEQIIGR